MIFGDTSQALVLEAANAAGAVLLVVTVPGIVVSQATIGAVRRMNPQIRVVARLSDTEFLKNYSDRKSVV